MTGLLVQRGGETYPQPKATMRLATDDLITVFGKPEKIAELDQIFKK